MQPFDQSDDPEELLRRARRDGDLGPLLNYYRSYLQVIARLEIGRQLQGKADASDAVQETLLQAHRTFAMFRGSTEAELLAWLRQILAHTLLNLVRRYFGRRSRDVRLEQELRREVDETSLSIARLLPSPQPSPSEQAIRREQTVILATLMEQLPADLRQVLILRHLEQLRFAEIAERMERSVDATRKLWARALVRLRQLQERTA